MRSNDPDVALLDGLSPPAQQLLLQLLLYKSIFMGQSFRELAMRERPEVGRALLRIHFESAAEAAGLALAVREWARQPEGDEGLQRAARDAQDRFLVDLIAVKEGVVDIGLSAASRAPTEALRERFTHLTDIDRRHADAIRALLGARTTADALANGRGAPLGVGAGAEEDLSRRVHEAVEAIRAAGGRPAVVVLSPEAFRLARREGRVDPATGRMLDLPVDVEAGWRGACFAIETEERIGAAEIVLAEKRLESA